MEIEAVSDWHISDGGSSPCEICASGANKCNLAGVRNKFNISQWPKILLTNFKISKKSKISLTLKCVNLCCKILPKER